MTIKEANNRLEKIDNDIEYWLNEKELLIASVEPKSMDTTKESVSGGKRVDKFAKYVIEIEPIDNKLDLLYGQKRNLEEYIEKELQRLGKYREVEQLIVYYKEQCLERYTWQQIAQRVYYSKEQCQRIYKKWKKERNIY